jgi:ankyrin repeat protein
MTAVDYSLMAMKEDDTISVVSHSTNQGAIRMRSVVARDFAAVQRRLVGRTALIKAVWKGIIGRVKTLLDLIVDKEIKDQWGWTALHWAAACGNKDVVEILLDEGKAEVGTQDKEGWTSLHRAAEGGPKDVLLEYGADFTAKNSDGSTVLHCAVFGVQLEVVKWLVEHGADVAENDNNGSTVLHSAVLRGKLEVVKRLVEHGADITAKRNDGLAALQLAASLGLPDIVVLLEVHGKRG